MLIPPTATIARASEVVATPVGDHLVVLNEELRYVGLDTTGQAVWELLETPRSLDELVEELVRRFDVEPDQCRDDVSAFLADLHRHRLVTVE